MVFLLLTLFSFGLLWMPLMDCDKKKLALTSIVVALNESCTALLVMGYLEEHG